MSLASILRKLVIIFCPIFVAILVSLSQKYEDLGYSAGRLPSPSMEGHISEDQMLRYKEDGYLLFKSLVTDDSLSKLQLSSKKVANTFFWTDWMFGKFYHKISMQAWKTKRDIAQFALESNLGHLAAQLLEETSSIRILKDAVFLHSPTAGEGCGYHLDDRAFWPASDSGLTFWVALSPMRIEEGGGIRLAKGSHTADWALHCREAIQNDTCHMKIVSPECHNQMNEVSVTFDMDPGDTLVWDRKIFHRSDEFYLPTKEEKLRYSIRYVSSKAKALGFHHPSVTTGEKLDGSHYPQVWPMPIPEEVEGFSQFGSSFLARFLPFY